eukprot:717550-Rhodomonas_salina.2
MHVLCHVQSSTRYDIATRDVTMSGTDIAYGATSGTIHSGKSRVFHVIRPNRRPGTTTRRAPYSPEL